VRDSAEQPATFPISSRMSDIFLLAQRVKKKPYVHVRDALAFFKLKVIGHIS
jgi:hypothetical protein